MYQVQNSFGPPIAARVGLLNILSKCATLAHAIMYKIERGHASDHLWQTGKGTIVEVTEPFVPEFTRVHGLMNQGLDGVP